MRFRRLVLLIITVLATFGSLMANPAGAIEPWEVTAVSYTHLTLPTKA